MPGRSRSEAQETTKSRKGGHAVQAGPVVSGLHEALAATVQLYRDTHLAHFNVAGPSFPQLHALFEEQYRELWEAMDEVAERVRALGAPVGAGSFAARGDELPGSAEGMLRHLAQGHRDASGVMQALVEAAEDAGDVGTADLATARLQAHDKHAWMLEATLG
jgi:starvation-inducible DNA-binding protein